MSVAASGQDLPANAQAFNLQFAATTSGPWTDLGDQSSSAIWRGFDNAALADETGISPILSSSDVGESYVEQNPSAPNPNAMLATSTPRGEWDWVVEDRLAPTGTFFFRMVKGDGTPLDSHANYPEISTGGPSLTQEDYRWYANDDSAVQGIAFDASSSNSSNVNGSTLTISHTIGSNDNRVLTVGTQGEDGSATDCDVSSVTFNGVTLTEIAEAVAANGSRMCVGLWYLLAPDVGTHDIVVTWAGNVSRRNGGGISIYNAAQQPPEAQNTQTLTGNPSSITTSITTATNGAWVIDAVGSGSSGNFTALEAGQTERYDAQAGSSQGAGSTKVVSTAGPTSMGWSQAANRLAHVVAAFAPSFTPPAAAPVWRGVANPSITDGTELPSLLLASSTVAETYEEENTSAANPSAIGVGNRAEWDWAVEPNGADDGTDYYFRMVTSVGTPFASYTQYPRLTTPPALDLSQQDYRWYQNTTNITPTTPLQAENTAHSGVIPLDVLRLRTNVKLAGSNIGASAESFKLQFATTSLSSSNTLSSAGSSLTVTHTVGDGPDRLLVVGAQAEDGSPGDCTVTSVTFDGTPLTRIARAAATDSFTQCVSLWYLLAPGTGKHDVVISWAGSVDNRSGGGISVYDVAQQGPEATSTQTLTGLPGGPNVITTNVTTVTDGAWVFDAVGSGNAGAFTVTEPGQIERYEAQAASSAGAGSTKVAPAATTTSLGWSQSANRLAHVVAAFAPATSSAISVSIGPFADVGDIGAGAAWRGAAVGGATTIDGATVPTLLLGSSTVAATFEEANPSATNPNPVADGDLAEWDWVLENNSAPTGTYLFQMVRSDGTELTSYARYAEVTTAGPTFTQEDYRWYLNTDSQNPTSALAPQNTPYTEASSPNVLRLRINVEVQDVNLPAGGQAFKLQFANSTAGPWTDVGAAGSLAPWRGFDNPSVADGLSLGNQKLSTTDRRESYEEQNPSVANPRSINVGQLGEWDWVVQDNNAASETAFYFRMVKADGTPLDGYTNYPQVTTTRPVVAFDDFESGGFAGGGGWLASWSTSGDASIRTSGSPQQGSYHMRLRRATGHADRSVDLSGETQVNLQFWAKARSFESGETATVSVSDDGVSFTVIHTWVNGDDEQRVLLLRLRPELVRPPVDQQLCDSIRRQYVRGGRPILGGRYQAAG